MRSPQAGSETFWKKEAPSEDGALNDRAEAKSKVMANGRGRRIRHSPGGHRSREEDTTSARLSQIGTEGGGFGRITSTTGIWTLTVWSAMHPLTCQLCTQRRQGQECCPKITAE